MQFSPAGIIRLQHIGSILERHAHNQLQSRNGTGELLKTEV